MLIRVILERKINIFLIALFAKHLHAFAKAGVIVLIVNYVPVIH